MLGVAPGPLSAISYGASIDIPSTDAAASENGFSRRLNFFSIIAIVG
jgi:hypothetical protein